MLQTTWTNQIILVKEQQVGFNLMYNLFRPVYYATIRKTIQCVAQNFQNLVLFKKVQNFVLSIIIKNSFGKLVQSLSFVTNRVWYAY